MEEKAGCVQNLVDLNLLIKSTRLKTGAAEFKFNISLKSVK